MNRSSLDACVCHVKPLSLAWEREKATIATIIATCLLFFLPPLFLLISTSDRTQFKSNQMSVQGVVCCQTITPPPPSFILFLLCTSPTLPTSIFNMLLPLISLRCHFTSEISWMYQSDHLHVPRFARRCNLLSVIVKS